MTEQVFTDSNGNTNRVYETAVKIVIDDLEFIQRGPVTNGSNPVKDNSMSQQRLWNCQTRLFVKGIAIRTGLGFDLWLKDELKTEKIVGKMIYQNTIFSKLKKGVNKSTQKN